VHPPEARRCRCPCWRGPEGVGLVVASGEEANDLLHACGGLVELAAHLGEPVVHLIEPGAHLGEAGVDLRLQPADTFVDAVEAGGGLHAECVVGGAVGVDSDAEAGKVTVAGRGEVPCGRGDDDNLLHAGLERRDGPDVGRVRHGQQRTGRLRAPFLRRRAASASWQPGGSSD
jgi:hypothetical protein